MRFDTDPLAILVYVASAAQLVFTVWGVWRRSKGGRVLFVIARRSAFVRWLAVLWPLWVFIILVFDMPAFGARNINTMVQAAMFMMLAQPTQVREQGISVPHQFVPWNKISEWSWSEGGKLSLRLRDSWSWDSKVEIVMEPELQREVGEVLARFVPGNAQNTLPTQAGNIRLISR